MPNQYFAALTNMRSVGVMGDERTYDYAVAVRAVRTVDFMTAEAAEIPFDAYRSGYFYHLGSTFTLFHHLLMEVISKTEG